VSIELSSLASSLSCTFEEAEDRNLSAGINASTLAKVAFFEEMLEFGFKFGAFQPNGPISWAEWEIIAQIPYQQRDR
jgi:uncharacterized protein YbjT (DUF2867 family)